MTTGRIDYSPDYKGVEFKTLRTVHCRGCNESECVHVLQAISEFVKEKWLRGAVVEAAKTLVREDVEKWDRLVAYRELHASVNALLEFEATQEKSPGN